ncbi:serine/threonine-protein kinase [Streptomyces sp. NPDC059928]|uniref:serine/threonine-protein kinase n=1 Tax=unclassified Streptomyces TaxID=2593676 RepID=UPI003662FCE6
MGDVGEAGATVGHVLGGRYELVSEIGHGGMGRVWEARDTQLDRSVAVKEVLLPALPPVQQELRLQLALREARNAAALADHPNIVTVYDVLLENGSPWIVMQLVRGRSLRHVLHGSLDSKTAADANGHLSSVGVPQAVRIAQAMLDALGALHTKGLVHRDIKPHNIMLADDGRVLLTDFGIAKSESDVTVTVSGSVMGTMAYIAPERVEGEPGTSASDLFSLGVTLFEAVEGYSPFEKKNSLTGTLSAILTKPLPPMVKAGPLAPLITALTLKLPEQRPDIAQARTLLANGRVDGWEMPSSDEAVTEVLPPADSYPKTLTTPTLTRTAQMPDRPTATAPRPQRVPAQAKSDPNRMARKAFGRVAGAVVVAAIGAVAIGAALIIRQDQATSNAACTTWSTGMAQNNTWVNNNLKSSGSPNLADFAIEEDRLAAVESQAATQTSDKALKAAFQQAAADHTGLAAAYRGESAGAADVSAYNHSVSEYDHYFGAANHDDAVQIQALCNKQ